MGQRPPTAPGRGPDRVWLYGRHAVLAALQNPSRKLRKLSATKNALDWLAENGVALSRPPVRPADVDRLLPDGAVHQGIAAEFDDLPRERLRSVCNASAGRPVLVLDQVTDPQNIGALFRIAAAFSAQAIIAQDRRTPPLAGALAKAAVGTIELVPFVSVVNISRGLEALTEIGFRTVGLAGETETDIADLDRDMPVALVIGAEGKGLRPLVREHCASLVRIPIDPRVESLNAATAAGIALYALRDRGRTA
jgi:23S rRNA (guanosine2251-2'-O)-methyltransferase